MSKKLIESEAFIITKTENDIKCYALQHLEMSPSISADVYAEFFASGQYIDKACDLDFIIKSIAYANELSVHKNLINSIKNKRKELANLDAAILRERKRLGILKNKNGGTENARNQKAKQIQKPTQDCHMRILRQRI